MLTDGIVDGPKPGTVPAVGTGAIVTICGWIAPGGATKAACCTGAPAAVES